MDLLSGAKLLWVLLPISGGPLRLLANLLPHPSTPPLVSCLGLASGAHHCTGILGVAPKWPAARAWRCGRHCGSRGHRLEDELRALGHHSVGDSDCQGGRHREPPTEPDQRGLGAELGHALHSLNFASARVTMVGEVWSPQGRPPA